MNYNDIHKDMRVRYTAQLFGELDFSEALQRNPGTVIEEPAFNQFTLYHDGSYENMIRVKHDDGRVMHHIADQLEVEGDRSQL